jgi:hypothetical protein
VPTTRPFRPARAALAAGLRSLAVALIGAAASLGAAPVARATVLVDTPLPDLVREADVIVRGTVLRTGRVTEVRQGVAEPWTVTTLRVTHWLKGQGGATVRISELGAVWQGGGHWIDGTPRYAPGDEVVVLLRDDGEGHLRTLSMVLGRFEVRRGVPGVPTTLHRDLGSVGLVQWAGGRMHVVHRDEEPALRYDDFVALVREVRLAMGDPPETAAPVPTPAAPSPVVVPPSVAVPQRGAASAARGGAR